MSDELTTPALASPMLRDWIAQVNRVTREARALRNSLTEQQLGWKPAASVWSINECFEHLVTADGLYHPVIASTLEGTVQVDPVPPFRTSMFFNLFSYLIKPSTRVRVKTTHHFVPQQDQVGVESFDRFFEKQEQLIEFLRRADGIDLNGYRLTSPANRFVKFSIGEALFLLVLHQQRHLQQANRVQEHPNFPTAS